MSTIPKTKITSIKFKPTKFQTTFDLMSWLCNMYADGDYCCDNEDFKEALRNHVRWVKVMNCGTSGTETLDHHYMLQVYLEKIGSVNNFNRKYNPKDVVIINSSIYAGAGYGLFAAVHFPKGSIITFYMGDRKSYDAYLKWTKKMNVYLFSLRGSPQTTTRPIFLHA